MTETLVINHLGHRGDGVADTPDGPVFVPYALPGETVEVEPVPGHPDRRHLLRVEHPSPDRIAAFCPHFGVCGGCAVQHWSEPRYREWKLALVTEAMHQAGIDAPLTPAQTVYHLFSHMEAAVQPDSRLRGLTSAVRESGAVGQPYPG